MQGGDRTAPRPQPFRGLELFGNGFLQKFMGSQCDSPLLHHVTLAEFDGELSRERPALRAARRRLKSYIPQKSTGKATWAQVRRPNARGMR